ncbi:hypothetical protein HGH92_00330 [Chitinophaga varians]|uniref:Uncharacterized protein n=1 Tax=Chitinophaga varians TaxID=2202339 RepID=A0A847RPX8_9BACT|nr:hypothetical protein [Chitinophaga varians]NLR62735.1 hypothetical protein [Chitinophaga varians]
MKKQAEKKLSLGKIKVSDLSRNMQTNEADNRSAACVSHPLSCLSQGAPVCSVDSCRF